MGRPVTITPDVQPDQGVTITPDAPAKPRSWTDSVSDAAKELWNQVNPIAGIQGAKEATAHPIDTLKNDAAARQQIFDKAQESFKNGDYTGGAAHLLYSFIPLLGENLERSGEQFAAGETAKGIGSSVGQGLNLAGPAVLKDLHIPLPSGAAGKVQSAAGEMYQSALKPSTTLSATEKANVVNAGLQNAIPISKEGLEKIGSLVDDLNNKIATEIQTGGKAGVTISPGQAASNLAATRARFATQVNPTADLAAIDASKADFLDQFRSQPGGAVRNMTAEEAQAMKQGTYRTLAGKYGEQGSASVEAQKALARGIREELNNAFPELQGWNTAESKLLNLEPVLERAVNRIGNHQLFGIGTPAAGMGMKAVTGSTGAAGVAAVIKMVLDNPELKSKLAIALSKAGAAQGVTLPVARARVAAYAESLGNVSSAPEQQSAQELQPAMAQ